MGQPSAPSVPKAPDPAKSYQAGVDVFLKNLPALLSAEQGSREQYDPARIAEQQGLQDQFGATQYAQQLDAFKALDPTYFANRETFGNKVGADYALGSTLSPSEQTQIEQSVRGAQAARGNIDGGAAGTAEAYALGDRGLALEQQRNQNMLGYLAAPTMAQQLQSVAPVSADRSFSYANPNAGYQGQQFALQNYQNILGAQSLTNGSGYNPWGGAATGAASGAALGSSFGPYGTAIGAVGGGVAGYLSDKRLKTDIDKVGQTRHGLGIYEFAYKGHKPRFRGVMAQELEKVDPSAVATHPSGYKMVAADYAPTRVS